MVGVIRLIVRDDEYEQHEPAAEPETKETKLLNEQQHDDIFQKQQQREILVEHFPQREL